MTVATPSIRQSRADLLDVLNEFARELERVALRIKQDPDGWLTTLDPAEQMTAVYAVYFAALSVADQLTQSPPDFVDRN